MRTQQTIVADGTGWRVRAGDRRALRVLEACPMVPAATFGAIAGLASTSGAYKQLARLRVSGLAEVRDEDLGVLFGDRRRGLWSVSDCGRHVLGSLRELGGTNGRAERVMPRLSKRQLPLRLASYWLLAWAMVETREHGYGPVLEALECPWVADIYSSDNEGRLRVKLPSAARMAREDTPGPARIRTLLLLPDLGTAPVVHYRETLRRLVIHMHDEQVKERVRDFDELLLVATPDPDGRGTRAAAWHGMLARVVRREGVELPRVRVVSWAEVDARVGGSAARALTGQQWPGTPWTAIRRSGREQVLHLLGRHPLLTIKQLANLLGTSRAHIGRFERELIELGWLRALNGSDASECGLDPEPWHFAHLGLVEVTRAGRRRLADMLGLDAPTASRYHGLISAGRAWSARRRQFLRILAHTVGTNDVFVAFARAAATARRDGGTDELAEWRAAAACERQRCKPDGYGLYRRNGVAYGFLLEYDRGTESARKYAAKFGAYYRYRDSGQAARDYEGLPTILFVTTSERAEDRIAEQAYRAWYARGTEALPVLLSTTLRLSGHPESVLGPIWRAPGRTPGHSAQREYWLPREGNPAHTSQPMNDRDKREEP